MVDGVLVSRKSVGRLMTCQHAGVASPSGRIVVKRPEPGWRDRLRSYAIEVDGQRRGRVKLGRVLIVDVPPGRHRIQARIDWTGSEPIDIDVAAGVDVHLVVETTGTAFEFWQAFTRSGYLCLRQA